MNVTKEQLQAEIICYESMDKCPDNCPFIGKADCAEVRYIHSGLMQKGFPDKNRKPCNLIVVEIKE